MTTLNPVKTKRLPALDIFRGFTILAMLIVNEIHAVKGTPDFLLHVPANQDGMSFADLIFPAFLFITGLAIPASDKSEISLQNFLSIFKRSAALIVLGLFMVNAEGGFQAQAMLISPKLWAILSLLSCYMIWGGWPACRDTYRSALRIAGLLGLLILALLYQDGSAKLSAMQTQWWGILGLIGWAYLLCATIYTLCRKRPILLALAQLALLLIVSLSPEGSLFHRHPHLSHAIIMLAGILSFAILHGNWPVTAWLKRDRKPGQAHTYFSLAMLTSLYFAAAGLAHAYFPYSKIGATPPWVLASIGFCIASYALLHALTARSAWHERFPLFMRAAQNALLCYTLPYLLFPALQLAGWSYPWVGADFFSGTVMVVLFALSLLSAAGYMQARGLRWKI